MGRKHAGERCSHLGKNRSEVGGTASGYKGVEGAGSASFWLAISGIVVLQQLRVSGFELVFYVGMDYRGDRGDSVTRAFVRERSRKRPAHKLGTVQRKGGNRNKKKTMMK